MGMMIGASSQEVKRITFYKADGTAVGTMSMSKPAKKKTKPFQYNFKEISTQILRAKTPDNARKAVSKAQTKAALLRQKLKNDEFDGKEIENALAHALRMEKIAKKRLKHLQQEEKIEQKGGGSYIDTDKIEEAQELEEDISEKKELEQKEKELKKLMQKYEKFMEDTMEKAEEMLEEEDLLEDFTEAVPEDMSPEDFGLLKKRNRAKELKEIMEADLKYLKAVFDKLAKEKKAISSGNIGSSESSTSGVAMELSGVEIPVETAQAPAVTEGSSVDIMI